jgi:hypothetical protein
MDTNHVRRRLHLTNIDKVPKQKSRLLQAMIQMQKEKKTPSKKKK